MKRKVVIIGVAAVVAGILAACGHDHSGSGMPTMSTPPTPPPSTAINVTTAQLLADYATQPSETGTPVTVNSSQFTLTDASDTSQPISVNGN